MSPQFMNNNAFFFLFKIYLIDYNSFVLHEFSHSKKTNIPIANNEDAKKMKKNQRQNKATCLLIHGANSIHLENPFGNTTTDITQVMLSVTFIQCVNLR